MMTIGLTTWTEHPSLLGGTDKLTLTEYSGVLPVVEVDTPFYLSLIHISEPTRP